MKFKIPNNLAIDMCNWLGKDGIAFFKEVFKKGQDLNEAVVTCNGIQHKIYFIEGRAARIFLRMHKISSRWSELTIDRMWGEVIKKAIKIFDKK